MKGGDPHRFAALRAEEIVRERNISSLPVNVLSLAADLDIVVAPKPASSAGVSGMLLRVGQNFGIAYATHIESEGFQRFSIAHELGHYFLAGHVDAVLANGDVHESRAGFASGDKYEMEADHFAAGLLMPKSLFVPALRKAGRGLSAVVKLAGQCVTSLPATAIRYTQCSCDPVAIVVSTGTTIDYCFMSDELREYKGLDWLRKGQGVPHGTATAKLNGDPENIRLGRRLEDVSTLSAWFGGNRDLELQEDVIGLGSYGKTLTVLYGIELPDEEEEEEERSMQESWTPKFRR